MAKEGEKAGGRKVSLAMFMALALTLSSCAGCSNKGNDPVDMAKGESVTVNAATPVHQHVIITKAAVPATCTANGLTAGSYGSTYAGERWSGNAYLYV